MKKIKYILLLTILGVIFAAIPVMAADITVVVDGKIVNFPDQKPYVDKNNRTLVPVRFPAETLGAKVDWVAERQEVLINKEADEHLWASDIKLKIGDKKVLVNGETKTMDTVAVITNSRTMVPVRFISEYMGATVRWHVGSSAAHIFTYGQSEQEQNRIIEEIAKQIQKLPPVEPVKPIEPPIQPEKPGERVTHDPEVLSAYNWFKDNGYAVADNDTIKEINKARVDLKNQFYVGHPELIGLTNNYGVIRVYGNNQSPNKEKLYQDIYEQAVVYMGKEAGDWIMDQFAWCELPETHVNNQSKLIGNESLAIYKKQNGNITIEFDSGRK